MKRRYLPILAAPAVAVLVNCAPPQTSSVGPIAPCTAAVTTYFETEPQPCIPVPPQRIDVYIETDGDVSGATARCNTTYKGAPTNEAPQYEGWLRCRVGAPVIN